jgi:hypothetical protein
MRTIDNKLAWQRGWGIGLALLSLVMPLTAVFPRGAPAAPILGRLSALMGEHPPLWFACIDRR